MEINLPCSVFVIFLFVIIPLFAPGSGLITWYYYHDHSYRCCFFFLNSSTYFTFFFIFFILPFSVDFSVPISPLCLSRVLSISTSRVFLFYPAVDFFSPSSLSDSYYLYSISFQIDIQTDWW